MKNKFRGTSSCLALMIALSGSTVFAQDAAQTNGSAADAPKLELDEVVVTGSRIKRSNLSSPSPVTIMDRSELNITGVEDVGDLLAELPSVDTSYNASTSYGYINISGLSQYNLRSLGSTRTLVLVDGRRMVGARHGGTAIDTNAIATDMIERVETMTGGASAIYGSDAIAGVVNIITRDNFEGFKVRGEYGFTEDGGRERYRASGIAGGNFADGRGNAVIALEYVKKTPVYSRQREWAGDCNYNETTSQETVDTRALGGYTRLRCTDVSTYIDGIRLNGGRQWYDRDGGFHTEADTGIRLTTGGSYTPGSGDGGGISQWYDRYTQLQQYGYDFVEEDYQIYAPSERFMISTKGRYEINESIEAYMYGSWASADLRNQTSADTLADSDVDNYFRYGLSEDGEKQRVEGIFHDNPFVTDEMLLADGQDLEDIDPTDYFNFRKRFTQVGPRSTNNLRDTTRIVVGARGTIFKDWDYDIGYTWGRTLQSQIEKNQIHFRNVAAALDLEAVPVSDANPTGFQCADPEARSHGCVPVDLISKNGLTTEMLQWITGTEHFRSINLQQTIAGHITGNPIELPAGELGIAVGFEHRRESNEVFTDTLTQNGLDGFSAVPNNGGAYNATDFYGEIFVPLLRDAPMARSLDASAAVRVANYSHQNIGSVTNYNFSLDWAPIEDIRFRGVFARATRAPDIRDSFSSARGTSFSFSQDPCDGLRADGSGVQDRFSAGCLADANVVGNIPGGGAFEGLDEERDRASNRGNPDIQPETADTYTLGAVITPTALPNFSMTIDYYNIKVDGAITTPARQDILDWCYSGTDTKWCDEITRQDAGQIFTINSYPINAETFKVSGIDAEVKYRLDLDDQFDVPGVVNFKLLWTRQLTNYRNYSQTDDAGNVSIIKDDYIGEVDVPKNRARFSVNYANGPYYVSWRTTYRGSVITDDNFADAFEASGDTEGAAKYLKIGDRFYHNLYLRYSFGDDEQYQVYANVDNVFNSKPPFIPEGVGGSSRTQSYTGYYDGLGRNFKIGMKISY